MANVNVTAGLGVGAYAPGEVARIAHIEPGRLHRWLHGYRYQPRGKESRRSAPLVQRPEQQTLTFLDLIEVCFVKAFLDHGVTMPTVRLVQEEAAREFGTTHPFCAQRFETDGQTIVARHRDHAGVERLFDLKRRQFLVREVFNPLLKSIDYDRLTKEARSWWPIGRNRPVVIDPARALGAALVSKSRVPTSVLYGAFLAGDDETTIADWYRVDLDEVLAAIEFENSVSRRAS